MSPVTLMLLAPGALLLLMWTNPRAHAQQLLPPHQVVSSYVDENGKTHQVGMNCQSGVYGGGGGSPFFEADLAKFGPITAVHIRSGSRIDLIQMRYGTTWGNANGGSGGSFHSFNVQGAIVRVDGRHGSRIDALQFTFTNGVKTPKYGGGGGSPFAVSQCPTCDLLYISGRSGKELDQIVFTFKCSQ